ncbi:winged helix-turn-helix transcriptional regulator [Streptomyces spectabilis]|uniref:Transcriptional regulator n=1 Tax=Streptomyces spectabilis TaxID=68270 RepID=A0A5P2X0B9_STRST|nr:winged helix-turn-helix transcriptional regulator [Streptomyces spectabilis]MBB5101000.1 DNA-binding HxlR family transcriptional regulator [Streptomyces spectabilis]MCI3900212.1 transcriptional regulator [Streptomyces spectabilis]QEV57818.1 transcriptional regulator [Streptomyces spectabilis]GGV08905.1 transcriptional regulator [Streptomyces spectabilis]
MGTKRYQQMCAVAAALDIVGERWTLLIIRDLVTGPKRYNQLLGETLVGIGPNLLASRLQMLTDEGLVEREPVPGDGRGVEYRLTESGKALKPVILGLASWGLSHITSYQPADLVRAEWGVLAVEAMVAAGPAPEADEAYEFHIGDQAFFVLCENGTATVVEGSAPSESALVVASDPETFIRVGTEQISPLDAVLSGKMSISGDSMALSRCLRLLGLSLNTDEDKPPTDKGLVEAAP